MIKKLLYTLLLVAGVSAASFSQSTPLYMGYYYNSDLSVVDTTTYMVTSTVPMTSDAGDVDGCYGLSLEPASGDMYILYQLSTGSAGNRRLGIIDVESGAITDIGDVGNMNDIGFVNGDLYSTSGSGNGQNFFSVDKTDGSTVELLSPTTDNEACALIHNYYNGNVYFLDEDHFTLIDLETNTETLTPGFTSFEEECTSVTMLTETTALVGNYDDLFLFDFETFTSTLIVNMDDNIHGMAFGEYPLVVAITGPSSFCSTDPSELSTTQEGTTYQWFLDGDPIDGATDATYFPGASGDYSCEVDGEPTKNDLTVEVIASPVVSFTATPNPVSLLVDPTGTVNFENTTPTGDEFFWDFDNGFTSMVENPSFPFALVGEYDVTLRVTDSETQCSDSLFTTVIVTDAVGVEVDENDFSVFPTVTTDLVTVTYAGTLTGLTGKLVDLNGRVIGTQQILPGANTTFDLSDLENGMYLIQINTENGEASTYRVTKQ